MCIRVNYRMNITHKEGKAYKYGGSIMTLVSLKDVQSTKYYIIAIHYLCTQFVLIVKNVLNRMNITHKEAKAHKYRGIL